VIEISGGKIEEVTGGGHGGARIGGGRGDSGGFITITGDASVIAATGGSTPVVVVGGVSDVGGAGIGSGVYNNPGPPLHYP
jgi:hypothetical protein